MRRCPTCVLPMVTTLIGGIYVGNAASVAQVLRFSLVLIVLFDAICKNVLLHGHEICQGLHYSSLCHVLPEDVGNS
uniref:Secreted protein n=1 Tax=Heterorhabditis bacteriophora TaxID=37862 RepID=A0A1I7WYH6_HETBA